MASIFNIGISALVGAQRQLSTTSHNIANVNTEGFSRQRAEFAQLPPQTAAGLFLGSGVQTTEITRVADQFLINQLQSANANEAKASELLSFATRIDSLVGDGTFNASLESFFGALQDANGNPVSTSAREVLLNSARSFAARFSDLEQRLSATARDINAEIEGQIDEVNTIATSIADLNGDIVLALGNSQGEPPNDLLDQRDRLINDLSKLVGVNALEQDDGALNVFIGSGQLIVAGQSAIPLNAVTNPLDPTRLEVATGSSIVSGLITNGELGAALEFRDDMLDPALNSVGRLAAAFAITFNEQHREGFDLNDNFGSDVFSIGGPLAHADATNTGTVSVSLDSANVTALTTADYRLTHDGTDFTLTNLANGSAQVLSGGGPFDVDGFTINITSPAAAGDNYLIQPTRAIARNMRVNITNAQELALARPNRTRVDIANISDAEISDPITLDVSDVSLLNPVQLVFNDPPTTFQVDGVGPLVPYTDGGDVDINGWRVQVSGTPEAGDVFHIEPNVGGAGDNGNGLFLGELQLTKIIDGQNATYQEAYSQLLGSVGAKTQQTQLSRDALTVLRDNAQASRDGLSAVNLDEEAAQLLRFQQAYSAAAQVISVANSTFDSLLAAVGR